MWTTCNFPQNLSYYSGKIEFFQAIYPDLAKQTGIFLVEKKWTGCGKNVHRLVLSTYGKIRRNRKKLKRKAYRQFYKQCG